jgi:TRAP-type transport system periplasmic protein
LKKIIDQNSGLEVSGWLGKVQQAGDVPARKVAVEERKNKVITIRGEALEGFRKAAIQLQDEWAKEMDSKGMNGKTLLEDAKALIKKHSTK